MHRFFISPDYIAPEDVVFPPEQAHQIRVVLRMLVGNKVLVLDNAGMMYKVVLTAVTRENVIGKIESHQLAIGEPTIELTLYQSFLKRDKFELVLQKCTELGVSRFVPIVTKRTLVQSTEMKENKRKRWATILAEAAEQSQRGKIPKLETAVNFKTMLNQLPRYDAVLMMWEGDGGVSLKTAVAERAEIQNVAVLIGPEGGWTEQEVELAKAQNAQIITLGPRILRTETAAIVASALVLSELEN